MENQLKLITLVGEKKFFLGCKLIPKIDAEGRLILADALYYSRNFHPHTIIDVATLTGAIGIKFFFFQLEKFIVRGGSWWSL